MNGAGDANMKGCAVAVTGDPHETQRRDWPPRATIVHVGAKQIALLILAELATLCLQHPT